MYKNKIGWMRQKSNLMFSVSMMIVVLSIIFSPIVSSAQTIGGIGPVPINDFQEAGSCGQYYQEGSVGLAISSNQPHAIARQPVTIKIIINNKNPYPIIDSKLTIKISSANGGTSTSQEIALIDPNGSFSIGANAATTTSFNWQVPPNIATGRYAVDAYVLQADKFYVAHNASPLYIQIGGAQTKPDISLAAPAYIETTATSTAQFFVVVTNNTAKSISVPVIFQAYPSLETESQSSMITSGASVVNIPAHSVRNVGSSFNNETLPSHVVRTQIIYNQTVAIQDTVFGRTDIPVDPHIFIAGLSEFPLSQLDSSNRAFVCTSPIDTAIASQDIIRAKFSLIDDAGKILATNNISLVGTTSSSHLVEGDAALQTVSTTGNLKLLVQLYKDDTLIDSVSIPYSCKTSDGKNLCSKSTMPISDHNLLYAILSIVIALGVAAGVAIYQKKNGKKTPPPSNPRKYVKNFSLMFLLGASILAGAASLTPQAAKADSTSTDPVYTYWESQIKSLAGAWDLIYDLGNFQATFFQPSYTWTGSVLNFSHSIISALDSIFTDPTSTGVPCYGVGSSVAGCDNLSILPRIDYAIDAGAYVLSNTHPIVGSVTNGTQNYSESLPTDSTGHSYYTGSDIGGGANTANNIWSVPVGTVIGFYIGTGNGTAYNPQNATSSSGDIYGGYCTDPSYTDEESCNDSGSCSGGDGVGYDNQDDCENAGYCDDDNYTDQESCESEGGECNPNQDDTNITQCEDDGTCYNQYGNDTGAGTEDDCTSSGTCDEDSYDNQMDCTTNGECSDDDGVVSTKIDQEDCENMGSCSDHDYDNNQEACVNAGYCTDTSIDYQDVCENTYYCDNGSGATDQESCTNSNSYCSISGYSDETSCTQSAGTCDPDSQYNNDYESCTSNGSCQGYSADNQGDCESDHGYCSDSMYSNEGDCENEGYCSDPAYGNSSSCTDPSNGSCSNSEYGDPDSCENAGYCSNGAYTDSGSCTSNGSCSGGSYPDSGSCQSAGYCSDGVSQDPGSCQANGSCSGGGYPDPTSCQNAGSCSDGVSSDPGSCEDNGSCSGGGYPDPTSCQNAGYCSDGGYSDQGSCTSNGSCSGGGYTDSGSCQNAGYCSNGWDGDPDSCSNDGAYWNYYNYTWNANTWNSDGYSWNYGTWNSDGYTWNSGTWNSYGYTWNANTWNSYGYTWNNNTWTGDTWTDQGSGTWEANNWTPGVWYNNGGNWVPNSWTSDNNTYTDDNWEGYNWTSNTWTADDWTPAEWHNYGYTWADNIWTTTVTPTYTWNNGGYGGIAIPTNPSNKEFLFGFDTEQYNGSDYICNSFYGAGSCTTWLPGKIVDTLPTSPSEVGCLQGDDTNCQYSLSTHAVGSTESANSLDYAWRNAAPRLQPTTATFTEDSGHLSCSALTSDGYTLCTAVSPGFSTPKVGIPGVDGAVYGSTGYDAMDGSFNVTAHDSVADQDPMVMLGQNPQCVTNQDIEMSELSSEGATDTDPTHFMSTELCAQPSGYDFSLPSRTDLTPFGTIDVYPAGDKPNPPAVTINATGTASSNFIFSITTPNSNDGSGHDPVEYAIDWGDGNIDTYVTGNSGYNFDWTNNVWLSYNHDTSACSDAEDSTDPGHASGCQYSVPTDFLHMSNEWTTMGTTTFRAAAVSNQGQMSDWTDVTINVGAGLTPPAGFGQTNLYSNCGQKVDLGWDAEDGADYYNIYRYDDNNPGAFELVGSSTQATYEDILPVEDADYIAHGGVYVYALTAVKNDGNESAFTDDVIGYPTPACGTIPAPTELDVNQGAVCGGDIDLSWTDVSEATSYTLDRYFAATSTPGYYDIATVTGTTTYSDNLQLPDASESYRIKATTNDAESIWTYSTGRASDPCPAQCGNHVCERNLGETYNNCPIDCVPECSDGINNDNNYGTSTKDGVTQVPLIDFSTATYTSSTPADAQPDPGCSSPTDDLESSVDCIRNGVVIFNGQTETFYAKDIVPIGDTCVAVPLTCVEGVLETSNGTPDPTTPGGPEAYPYSYCRENAKIQEK